MDDPKIKKLPRTGHPSRFFADSFEKTCTCDSAKGQACSSCLRPAPAKLKAAIAPASAETGGEKAADDSPEKQMESLNKLREEILDYSPCPSREPEKLNNAHFEQVLESKAHQATCKHENAQLVCLSCGLGIQQGNSALAESSLSPTKGEQNGLSISVAGNAQPSDADSVPKLDDGRIGSLSSPPPKEKK